MNDSGIQMALDDLLGGATQRVRDWRPPTDFSPEDVIPTWDDTLPELRRKSAMWRTIVESGRSLAAAFGWIDQDTRDVNFVAEAKKYMSPQERNAFELWEKGAVLKPVDWNKCAIKRAATDGSEKTLLDKLEALKRVYKNKELTMENCVWFMRNKQPLHPLLFAVMGTIKAYRAATNSGSRDARELKEQQAARLCNKIASTKMNDAMKAIHALNKEFSVNLQAVQARSVAVAEPGKNAAKRQVPVNQMREEMGQPLLGKPVDYTGAATRGRLSRLMGGAQERGAKRGREATQNPYGGTGFYGEGEAGPSRQRLRREASPVYRPLSPGAADDDDLGGDPGAIAERLGLTGLTEEFAFGRREEVGRGKATVVEEDEEMGSTRAGN